MNKELKYITNKQKSLVWQKHFNDSLIGHCKCCCDMYPIYMPLEIRKTLKIHKDTKYNEIPEANFRFYQPITNTKNISSHHQNDIINNLFPICMICNDILLENEYIINAIVPMALDDINMNENSNYNDYILLYLKNNKKCIGKRNNGYFCCNNVILNDELCKTHKSKKKTIHNLLYNNQYYI
jgi:hypothetical protein